MEDGHEDGWDVLGRGLVLTNDGRRRASSCTATVENGHAAGRLALYRDGDWRGRRGERM